MGRAGGPAWAGVLCSFFILSCAPKRAEVPLDPSAVEITTLISMVQQRSMHVQSLTGYGVVTFEGKELGGTASFELSLRKPDSLLVLLEGPFGIDIGTLFLSSERYLAYNSQQNVVVTGNPEGETISSVIPFDLSFDEVLNAFAGTVEIPFRADEMKTYAVDEGMFFVVFSRDAKTFSFWIDHTIQQVARYEVHDRDGKLLLQSTMSSFSDDGVPKRIVLWFPKGDRQIAVQYSALTVNPDELSFAYSVPDDARVVRR